MAYTLLYRVWVTKSTVYLYFSMAGKKKPDNDPVSFLRIYLWFLLSKTDEDSLSGHAGVSISTLHLGMAVFLLQHIPRLLCRVGWFTVEPGELNLQNVGPVL